MSNVLELIAPGMPANVCSIELQLVGAIVENPRRYFTVQSLVRGRDFFVQSTAGCSSRRSRNPTNREIS